MVVPVKVIAQDESGQTAIYLAHTLDATEKGARLGGFHGKLNVGQSITVQYQHRRSKFCVVWIGKYGTAQGTQLGIECLDSGKDIWQIEEEQTSSALGSSRRSSSIIMSRWGLETAF